MKAQLSLTNIIIVVMLMLLVGSTLVGVIEDVAYTISCGFCQKGNDQFMTDLVSIVTAGQHDVLLGVNGLEEMKNMSSSEVSPLVREGLHETYKMKILLGSLLTIIFIFLFYLVINKLSEWWMSGLTVPTGWGIVASLVIVGLLHFFASGMHEFPYQGWVTLAMHPDIWAISFYNAVSPVPKEALNGTIENISHIGG